MPKTIEELTKDFESLTSSVGTMQKDFDLKLNAAKKDADEYKSIAEKSQDELKAFQAKAEEEKKATEKLQFEARGKEIKAFTDDMKRQGKITPAMESVVTRLMEAMTSVSTAIKYEENGKKIEHSLSSLFREFVEMLPKGKHVVQFSEVGKIKSTTPDSKAGEVNVVKVHHEGGIQEMETEGDDLHTAALEFQAESFKAGKVVSYADALLHASKQINLAA